MANIYVTSDRCDPHKWSAHQWNRERPIFWPNKMIPTVFKVNVILTWDESYQAVQCYPIQCHLTNFDQLVIFSLPSCNKLGMAMKWLCEINKYYNANLDSERSRLYHRSMLIKNWFGTPIPNGQNFVAYFELLEANQNRCCCCFDTAERLGGFKGN